MERKARLRELFKKSVRRVIIMQRVSAAISRFALTRQTERELKARMKINNSPSFLILTDFRKT